MESVDVSLNQGRATVSLKPGNHATLAQLRAAVAKNGFANKDANVVAAGEISSTGGQMKFEVTGTSESFTLSASSGISLQPAASVVLEGTVPPPSEKGKASSSMQVKSIKPI